MDNFLLIVQFCFSFCRNRYLSFASKTKGDFIGLFNIFAIWILILFIVLEWFLVQFWSQDILDFFSGYQHYFNVMYLFHNSFFFEQRIDKNESKIHESFKIIDVKITYSHFFLSKHFLYFKSTFVMLSDFELGKISFRDIFPYYI